MVAHGAFPVPFDVSAAARSRPKMGQPAERVRFHTATDLGTGPTGHVSPLRTICYVFQWIEPILLRTWTASLAFIPERRFGRPKESPMPAICGLSRSGAPGQSSVGGLTSFDPPADRRSRDEIKVRSGHDRNVLRRRDTFRTRAMAAAKKISQRPFSLCQRRRGVVVCSRAVPSARTARQHQITSFEACRI
jgi:hypothetical protein